VIAEQMKSLALIIGITLLSGLADAQGFIHAARIWQSEGLVWAELGRSAAGFLTGIASYWLSLRYMKALGVLTPEVQTLVWFGVTLIGVAIISGKVFRWPLLDQGVAVAVLAGIAWLLFHTSS
jgi:hypothetical protein